MMKKFIMSLLFVTIAWGASVNYTVSADEGNILIPFTEGDVGWPHETFYSKDLYAEGDIDRSFDNNM